MEYIAEYFKKVMFGCMINHSKWPALIKITSKAFTDISANY